MLKRIHHQRNLTWHFQDLMGKRRTPYLYWAENRCGNKNCRYQVLKIWRLHHRRAKWHYEHRPKSVIPANIKAAFLCIHHYEGAWNANTGNGYYGGLQMDYSFQQTYGPEYLSAYGTADKWPPIDQMIAAYRAYKTRGFTPWPNTAAACGLL